MPSILAGRNAISTINELETTFPIELVKSIELDTLLKVMPPLKSDENEHDTKEPVTVPVIRSLQEFPDPGYDNGSAASTANDNPCVITFANANCTAILFLKNCE